MQRSTHVIGGVTAGLIVASLLNLPWYQTVAGISISAICGFLPDQIQWSSGHVEWKFVEGHRGISHWLTTAGIASALIGTFHPGEGLFVFAGLVSHLLLDLPGDMGIPLLMPFVKRRFALGWFNNGGRGEFITAALLVTLSFLIITV